MDIYKFINSKDIESYLRKITYKFNSLETAWLIHQCKKISLENKIIYLKKLIETMPDCEIPQRINCDKWSSLDEYLRKYIDIVLLEKKEFFKVEDNNYVYSVTYRKYKAEECDNRFFSNIEACLNYCQKVNDDTDSNSENIKFCIRKQSLIEIDDYFEIECYANGELIEIKNNSKKIAHNNDILWGVFDGLWFDFPVPFKKGDILWKPIHDKNKRRGEFLSCVGPFVLIELDTHIASKSVRECGDVSDMGYEGWFASDDGSVYWEVSWNYMDLEYFEGEYLSYEKILLYIEKHLKEKLDIEILLRNFKLQQYDILMNSID